MLEVYRSLVALRRAHPELRDPSLVDTRVEVSDDDRRVLLHRGPYVVDVDLDAERAEGRRGDEVVWSSDER